MSASRSIVSGLTQKEDQGGHPCDFCDQVFWSELLLSTHRILHTDKKRNYSCQICNVSFSEPSQLEVHLQHVHNNETQHKCQYCAIKFSQTAALETHTLTYHTLEKKFRCTICNASFVKPIHLEQHSVIHKDKNWPKLDYFTDDQLLKSLTGKAKRNFNAGNGENGPYSESNVSGHDISQTKFLKIQKRVHKNTSSDYLSQAKKRLVTRVQSPPSSEGCENEKQSDSNSSYAAGETEEEAQVQSTVADALGKDVSIERKRCQVCGTAFRSISALTLHVCRTKTQAKTSSISMELRGSDKAGKDELLNNTVSVYSKRDKSACGSTSASSKWTIALRPSAEQATKVNQTSAVNRIKCRHCSNTFSNFANMLIHARSHANEKPYRCNICEKEFPQISNFRVHMNRRHDDLLKNNHIKLPYGCNVCNKNFSKYDSLLADLQNHRDGPTFFHECKFCMLIFTYPQNLAKHEQSCSQTKVLEPNQKLSDSSNMSDILKSSRRCPRCNQAFKSKLTLELHILNAVCGNTKTSGETDHVQLTLPVTKKGKTPERITETHHNQASTLCPTKNENIEIESTIPMSKIENSDSPKSEAELETFMCAYCDSHFLEMAELSIHIKSHVVRRD